MFNGFADGMVPDVALTFGVHALAHPDPYSEEGMLDLLTEIAISRGISAVGSSGAAYLKSKRPNWDSKRVADRVPAKPPGVKKTTVPEPEVLERPKLSFEFPRFKNEVYYNSVGANPDIGPQQMKEVLDSNFMKEDLEIVRQKFGEIDEIMANPKKKEEFFQYLSTELPKRHSRNNPYDQQKSESAALKEYGDRSTKARAEGGPICVIQNGMAMCSDLSLYTHLMLSKLGVESKCVGHRTEGTSFSATTGHMALRVGDTVIDPNRAHIWKPKPGEKPEPTVLDYETWKKEYTFDYSIPSKADEVDLNGAPNLVKDIKELHIVEIEYVRPGSIDSGKK
jgi:hypothetical protein